MAHSEIITKLKQTVMKQIVNNREIVDAIDSPDSVLEDWIPIYLIDSLATSETEFTPHIYSYYKFPQIIEKDITFLSVMVNTTGYEDSNMLRAELHIVIFTHKTHMLMKQATVVDNRNDYISKLLDNQFNGKTLKYDDKDIYIGKFYLAKNAEDSYDENFLMRHLVFICNDINASVC